MWRAVVFAGFLLSTGGETGGAGGGANGGEAGGANGEAVGGTNGGAAGEANGNLNINCSLYLRNPDRCIFFIELNSTSSIYYAKHKDSLDLVKKVCGGSHTLNGTSVTSSYVKLQRTDELKQITEKYPQSNAREFLVLAGTSNGTSSGEVNDYAVYHSRNGRSHIYLSNDTSKRRTFSTWVASLYIPLKYIACQVDLTPASTPKPDAKPKERGSQAAGGKAAGQIAEAADQFAEGNYVFCVEQLPPQVSETLTKTSIDCITDATFVDSNILVSITDANCISDLNALGITSTRSGLIERSFAEDAVVVEGCKEPQLKFIGVERNALIFAFHCRRWECKRPEWPSIVISVLVILLVCVLSGIGVFLYKDKRRHRATTSSETIYVTDL